MKKYLYLIITMILLITACGKTDVTEENVSDNKVTIADELTSEISENVVPAEAMVYSTVSFNIPEGFVADEDNTDTKAYYLSQATSDLSFIAYQRRDNSGKITIDTMTEDDFKNAFIDQLGVKPDIVSYEKMDKDFYFRILVDLKYSVAGISYDCREYIFVTDDYIFTVTYCIDMRDDWVDAFIASADSISFVSVMGTVVDKDVEGIVVTEELEVPSEDNDNNSDVSQDDIDNETVSEDDSNSANSIMLGE